MADPILQLLSSGLQFWIRQQCQSVEQLELQLHGSSLGLLRGRLEGVSLLARQAIFSDLELERVELRSGAIAVQMGTLLKQQTLQLEQPFSVSGRVSFSGPGLNRSLATSHWRGLADQISEALLGITPLQQVRIEADQLIFSAAGLDCSTRPEVEDGCLALRAATAEQRYVLPGDPNISIEQASLGAGLLELSGSAKVTP
ncbi:MAG: DUF2993 domain-containing protein [Vulcanococcus sp.]